MLFRGATNKRLSQLPRIGSNCVAFGREVTLAPASVLFRPGLLQPANGRGRKPAGVLAEQRHERLLEVTGRDPPEVEDWDQHFEAVRSARDLRLDSVRQQRSRAVAQNFGQQIGKSSWLAELEIRYAALPLHGVTNFRP